jgi:anaerobic magnesium-protoporphyrin IX monomethyl ester cyclase
MTTVTLVYPYFHPSNDNSIFRFPPLGLGYIAAHLKNKGISVELVDCTFLSFKDAMERIRNSHPRIIGLQVMFSMKEKALQMVELLRKDCELLVAGGPLPTSNPEEFLQSFDVVGLGEGEETMLDIVQAVQNGKPLKQVKGIAYKDLGKTIFTAPRDFINNLDEIPFPAREMFDNQAYKAYYSRNFGYTTTSIMTSRGCPFQCDFCSRPVFGNRFRSRTPKNIAEEVQQVHDLCYDRVWFADDCFTLGRKRFLDICHELIRRRINIGWECLSRVDTIDEEVAEKMRKAGCVRVFFGIESGNDTVLKLMNKQITVRQAEQAVNTCKKAGIQVGAFFILGYPGETDKTVLDTVDFASSLPLDYLSFTFPYPIPGTPLYERVKDSMIMEEWTEPDNIHLIKHKLLYQSSISESKLKFALFKGMTQHYIRKYLGNTAYGLIGTPFAKTTKALYKAFN